MTMRYTQAYFAFKRREQIAAMSFGLLLVAFAMIVLVVAMASMGPVVLGTEMNANGLVEYLCLGNGCEHKTAMTWSDRARI